MSDNNEEKIKEVFQSIPEDLILNSPIFKSV